MLVDEEGVASPGINEEIDITPDVVLHLLVIFEAETFGFELLLRMVAYSATVFTVVFRFLTLGDGE